MPSEREARATRRVERTTVMTEQAGGPGGEERGSRETSRLSRSQRRSRSRTTRRESPRGSRRSRSRTSRRESPRGSRRSRSRSTRRESQRGSRDRTRGRERSRRNESRRRSSSNRRRRDNSEIRLLKKKLLKLEKKQEAQTEFKSEGIRKQHEFNVKVMESLGKLRDEMEEAFAGKIPENLDDTIKEGEDLLDERLHTLKIADEFGWPAVRVFEKEDLARNDKEEKKLGQLRKEQLARQAKAADFRRSKADRKKFWPSRREEYPLRRREGFDGSYSDKRQEGRTDRYSLVINNQMWDSGFAGVEKGRSASIVTELVTMPESVPKEIEGTVEGPSEEEREETQNFIESNGNKDFIKLVSDDGSFMDKLEGVPDVLSFEYLEELEGDEVGESKDEEDRLVVESLRNHKEVWEEFGAGKMCMNIIEEGLKLNFTVKGLPGKYQEKNNKSFFNNKNFATEEIEKLLRRRVIEEVDHKEVACINPMSVASNREGKKRLCIDLSRHVNDYCKAKKFRIESVSEFSKAVKKGSWLFSFDLKSAYHHVVIHKNHRKFLGFSLEFHGKVRTFQFVGMPFGYKDASRILTKMLRVPLHRWRRCKAPVYIHIDDGLGVAETKEEAERAANIVKNDLEDLGLITSLDKCLWKPTQELVWCGFLWNLRTFTVEVTKKKAERIKSLAKELLKKKTVTVKEMSALTGLVVSCSPALGRSARFKTRASIMWVQQLVDKYGWKAFGIVSDQAKLELMFWRDKVEKVNGQVIRHEPGVVKADSFGFSDAGGHQIGGVLYGRDKTEILKEFKIQFSEEEKKMSSTYRELRGIEEGLKMAGEAWRRKSVRWGCDNWAAVKACELGSTKADCMEVANNIGMLAESFEMKLEVVWKRRNTDEIVVCDKLSKEFDLSEYRIVKEDFIRLDREFGPLSVDWFASSWSARLDVFSSKYADKGCQFVDAFANFWGTGFGYFHPPMGEVARVLEKAKIDEARGILIVPDWPGSEVVSLVELEVGTGVEFCGVRKVEFESASWIESNTFHGFPSFGIRVYRLSY